MSDEGGIKDIQGKLYYVKYKVAEPMMHDGATTSRPSWATQQFVLIK